LWNGRHYDLSADPKVTINIPSPTALRYFIAPDLNKLGEAYVEGHINVTGPIEEVFKVGEGLARAGSDNPRGVLHNFITHTRERDRAAIEYHYDVSNAFYALFLDPHMVYSCAYFKRDGDTLEQAQLQKVDHILRKLRLRPGERLLDIGCGWGTLVMRAAQVFGAHATGVTLSQKQY